MIRISRLFNSTIGPFLIFSLYSSPVTAERIGDGLYGMNWLFTSGEYSCRAYMINPDFPQWGYRQDCQMSSPYPNSGYCSNPSAYPVNYTSDIRDVHSTSTGNVVVCRYGDNGGYRQGYAMLEDYRPGAFYDHTNQCTIELELSGATYFSPIGFSSVSNNRKRMVVSNCKQGLLELGIKTGYGSGWVVRGNSYLRQKGVANHFSYAGELTIFVDGQRIASGDGGSTNVTPPEPVICNYTVPPAIDHGTINLADLDSSPYVIETITYDCTGSASISFSFISGSWSSSKTILDLKGGLYSDLCFLKSGVCSTASGGATVVNGSSGAVELKSVLHGVNVTNGEHSAPIVVRITAN
ncbi:hypothetical protein [Providencia manganoxydans]|uniref:hypothetical protein n=1 Tax=Providencia manganoxydans TaxID=2923283 RepID=UPI0034DD14FA